MNQKKTRTISVLRKPKPAAGPRSRAAKVFHITDFQDLYELTDDVRKERSGPLRYVKSLVTLSSFCPDAETRHFERMHALRARAERHLLRSILEDLKAWVAAKPFGLRGYLITVECKPASCEYLAEQLTVPAKDIRKALPILEQLGFLERVPMNGQIEQKPAHAQTKRGAAGKPKDAPKKSTRRNTRKSKNAAKRTVEGSTEGLPDSAGLGRFETESLCPPSRKDNGKGKNKFKTKDKGKATLGLAASGSKKKNNDNGKDDPQGKATLGRAASGSKKENNDNGKDDPQGKATEQVPCPPTTPEPLPSAVQPQESDGQRDRVTPTPSPLPSLSNGQSSHGLSYGRRVYLGLGYRHDVGSVESRREITSFASKHDQIVCTLAGLSPPAVDALLARGLAEAVKIGRRKGNRSKGAVWHTVMDRLTAAAQRPP